MKFIGHSKDSGDLSTDSLMLTIADNTERKKIFQTRTILTEEAGEKVIYKYAGTDESRRFIEHIIQREKENDKYLKGQFEVLHGQLQGDRIRYDYLAYPSLTDEIAFHMKAGRYDKVDELMAKYVDKIRSLSIVRTRPEAFLHELVKDSNGAIGREECLERGLLDLTTDNILINGRHWIVLDNEWSFEFPIPVAFVLFRTILPLAIKLQSEIRRSASHARPVVGIYATRIRTFYIPVKWAKYISVYNVKHEILLAWEKAFQQYVTGSAYTPFLRIRSNQRTRRRFLFRGRV